MREGSFKASLEDLLWGLETVDGKEKKMVIALLFPLSSSLNFPYPFRMKNQDLLGQTGYLCRPAGAPWRGTSLAGSLPCPVFLSGFFYQ